MWYTSPIFSPTSVTDLPAFKCNRDRTLCIQLSTTPRQSGIFEAKITSPRQGWVTPEHKTELPVYCYLLRGSPGPSLWWTPGSYCAGQCWTFSTAEELETDYDGDSQRAGWGIKSLLLRSTSAKTGLFVTCALGYYNQAKGVGCWYQNRFSRTAWTLSLWSDFEAFIIEQEALPRTLLSSFLHNCQHSIRTDRQVHLLCGLELSWVSLIGLHANWPRTPGASGKKSSSFQNSEEWGQGKQRWPAWCTKGKSCLSDTRPIGFLYAPLLRKLETTGPREVSAGKH